MPNSVHVSLSSNIHALRFLMFNIVISSFGNQVIKNCPSLLRGGAIVTKVEPFKNLMAMVTVFTPR